MSWAVIGGSGLYQFEGLDVLERKALSTPYGEPSDSVTVGELEGRRLLFLPRHGASHRLPPHKVNYRANIWALHELGAKKILAVNAVGGIAENLQAGDIVIPDQLIDYTWGREHTYDDGTAVHDDGAQQGIGVQHIDFTEPFSPQCRVEIIQAASTSGLSVIDSGVYGCTQGPRLETAAEVRRLGRDGCTVVGMTAMPEAALARELELAYASISVVANPAAGLSDELITIEDIESVLSAGLDKIKKLIKTTVIEASG